MHNNKVRREMIYIWSGGICIKCRKPLGYDFQRHHSEHDTVGNNKKRPLYTQSLISYKAMHGKCHEENPAEGKITETQADLWEVYLQSWVELVKSGAVIPLNLVIEEMKLLKTENKPKGVNYDKY